GRHREPDLRFVLTSTRMVAERLQVGQLVVLESTTYPGTTREELRPLLEETGLRCGKDFFLAYSPEREDPGRLESTASIPKLVGGVDSISGDLAEELYKQVVSQVHRVESSEIAEAAKLLENIYRAVNIALVNELKLLLTEMDIDVWKVIEAASTKPFGFQSFYPGPGLGGHCIPIDPFYLTWKAKEMGLPTRFIELAGEINSEMPEYVISRVMSALNRRGKALRDSRVLLCGVAYKKNVDDVRESPAAEIIKRLGEAQAIVEYHDPHVAEFPKMRRYTIELSSRPLTPELLQNQDCVIIVTDHDSIDWPLVGEHAPLVVDTRNVLARFSSVKADVVKA
ncbi:MAG: nucleotide sugar dehydrogenase, partial [Planctomycetota bacterium]